jgi:hypothetical protein
MVYVYQSNKSHLKKVSAVVSKLSWFMAPLVSQKYFTEPLGQNKCLTIPFTKQLGPDNLITVCPNNLRPIYKHNAHKLKANAIFWKILQRPGTQRSTVWESPGYGKFFLQVSGWGESGPVVMKCIFTHQSPLKCFATFYHATRRPYSKHHITGVLECVKVTILIENKQTRQGS